MTIIPVRRCRFFSCQPPFLAPQHKSLQLLSNYDLDCYIKTPVTATLQLSQDLLHWARNVDDAADDQRTPTALTSFPSRPSRINNQPCKSPSLTHSLFGQAVCIATESLAESNSFGSTFWPPDKLAPLLREGPQSHTSATPQKPSRLCLSPSGGQSTHRMNTPPSCARSSLDRVDSLPPGPKSPS